MNLAVGTVNQAKVSAVKSCWLFGEVKGFKTQSGVKDQPFGHDETRQGAINRAINAAKCFDGAAGIGLEGGVAEHHDGLYICNWGALYVPGIKEPFTASGASIRLPDEIAAPLRNGEELGPLMEQYSKQKNIRQNEGAVGFFTNGRISRSQMFEHIVELLIGQWEYTRGK
ncbi:hypothetical protein KP77_23850 [Jeotgalibacillus alimentarius]|uniref:inosine/xanthosine triphosphatase n=1 Tax=Jeotgalibacillus alimentarius TaxID=135826 RepID=A0A0C2RAE3_9BACL|nr:DUF84 family protein [Jeotgalibacillus alimentarius]KIL47280.1 hypothetical protein KP77_23850 [Jeotgalibacillus alimentarius]